MERGEEEEAAVEMAEVEGNSAPGIEVSALSTPPAADFRTKTPKTTLEPPVKRTRKSKKRVAASGRPLTILRLPPEVLAHVFRFLAPSELSSASQVCQRWCRASQWQRDSLRYDRLRRLKPVLPVPPESLNRASLPYSNCVWTCATLLFCTAIMLVVTGSLMLSFFVSRQRFAEVHQKSTCYVYNTTIVPELCNCGSGCTARCYLPVYVARGPFTPQGTETYILTDTSYGQFGLAKDAQANLSIQLNTTVDCFYDASDPTQAVLDVPSPIPLSIAAGVTFGSGGILAGIGAIIIKIQYRLHVLSRRIA